MAPVESTALPRRATEGASTSPVRVTELKFNGGQGVLTEGADIVVLVGPNNSGKTRSLVEMQARLALSPGQVEPPNFSFALEALKVQHAMSGSDFVSWLKAHRRLYQDPVYHDERVRSIGGSELALSQIPQQWQTGDDRLGFMAPHLVRGLWCGERLGYLGAPGRLEAGAHPDQPIQAVVTQSRLIRAFRKLIREAFEMNVIVDAWGSQIRLRVGRSQVQDDFTVSSQDGLPDPEVVGRLSAVPLLESQSDGVRSFAGVLLTLLAGDYPVVLIDEPEAFLHPPQARLLGRSLARQLQQGQLFVATHSVDVLLGLLDTPAARILVLRLTRAEERTAAQALAPDQLAGLWGDPLVRFSRVLDGLFHHAVVVCEGVTDCQFYASIASEHSLYGGLDVMFTFAGSKQRIPVVTRALGALGVPVRAVVDFDALRDANELRSLVEGVGGRYEDSMERDRRILDAHLRGSEPIVKCGAVSIRINSVLGGDPDQEMTAGIVGEIERALRPETGWRAAKRVGRAAVPHGEGTAAVDRLLAALHATGVFVVPSGAVESFVPAVGREGPRWVVEVVEGGHVGKARDARDFVLGVLSSLPGYVGGGSSGAG
jgi:hypothetical protein